MQPAGNKNTTTLTQVSEHPQYGLILRFPGEFLFFKTSAELMGSKYEKYCIAVDPDTVPIDKIRVKRSEYRRMVHAKCDACNEMCLLRDTTEIKGVNTCDDCLRHSMHNSDEERAQRSIDHFASKRSGCFFDSAGDSTGRFSK